MSSTATGSRVRGEAEVRGGGNGGQVHWTNMFPTKFSCVESGCVSTHLQQAPAWAPLCQWEARSWG